ncbi:RNA 2',3'-cyclic phosphodiesterase [Algiphilus sp.]|uniref:RNA 2',3'-cyclic phosphodiesterase n=1 Tax=Algiphilus sp. TaxID=1872431 RepID=UPI0025C00E8F|nr:RNA 2',3'-cyclic phosphodiesterase [Algiphilus sp.]
MFFALWPDAPLRDALCRYQRHPDAGGRPIANCQLHLTLAFAGRVSPAQGQGLRDAAATVTERRFFLSLDWLDHFRATRVQWLGPRRPPDALLRLAAVLRGHCRAAGIAQPEANFQPHVTLQRQIRRPLRGAVAPALGWWVDHFVLVESGAQGRAGDYRVVSRWPLR